MESLDARIARNVEQLRADERRSESSRRAALQEINERIGYMMHGEYGYTPGRGYQPARPKRVIPDLVTDPGLISQNEFRNLGTLGQDATWGRRLYVELVVVGKVWPHPALYTQHLEMTRVYGLPIVIGKGEFQEGDIAIYVPIGTQVPPAEALRFVHQNRDWVVKARRFRGVESCGVLLPLSEQGYVMDAETGRKSRATAAVWNVWLKDLVGRDVSAWMNMRNPV